ncbi:MAG TPA: hypothetical protein VN381_15900 [Anaerovoracaceae bacterium]|nr:hypothetical protein [Anaerovoracaceae bacterium]
MGKVSVTYLNNCGIMLESGKILAMIDGITADDNMFDVQSDTLKAFIDKKLRNFNGRKVMLFTHGHKDHYDDLRVLDYIKKNLIDHLVISLDEKLTPNCTSAAITNRNIFTMNCNEKESGMIEMEEGMTVHFYRTRHLPYEWYDGAPHYSVHIGIEDKNYIMIGDTDAEQVEWLLSQCPFRIDGLFINPAVLGKEEWIKPLFDKRIANIYVYHLASEAADRFGYRKFAEKKYDLYRKRLPNLKLLLNGMELSNVECG